MNYIIHFAKHSLQESNESQLWTRITQEAKLLKFLEVVSW